MTLKLNKEEAFKTILDKRGGTYINAVLLLEEIVRLYAIQHTINKGSDLLKVNYGDIEKKLGLNHNKIKYALKVLEEQYDIIKKNNIFPKDKSGKFTKGTESFITLNFNKVENIVVKENV